MRFQSAHIQFKEHPETQEDDEHDAPWTEEDGPSQARRAGPRGIAIERWRRRRSSKRWSCLAQGGGGARRGPDADTGACPNDRGGIERHA